MGAGHRRRGGTGPDVRRAVPTRSPPRAVRTPTPAPPSATGSASARRGSTGSPRGPATPRSPSGGSSTCEKFVNKGGSTLRVDRDRARRSLDPGGRQSLRRPQHGGVPAVDDRPEVRPAGPDGHCRSLLHQGWELHALEHQRRHQPVRDRRRHGDLPVQLPRRRDRRRRCGQGAQPRTQRAQGRRSTAPWPVPSSTCSRSSLSSASCRPRPWPRTATRRPTPPRPTRSRAAAGWATSSPPAWSSPASAPSTAGP